MFRTALSTACLILVAGACAFGGDKAAARAITAISIVDFSFQPGSVNINPGDVVTWTNNGAMAHTTTSDTGLWDSGSLQPGQSFSFTFATAGSFDFHCNIHPFMAGTVVVGAASAGDPSLTSPLSASGTVGVVFNYTITATGSTPITFVASGMPPWMTQAGALLTGTPTDAGTFSISLQATNSVGTTTQTLVLTISTPGGGTTAPLITSALTATGQVGVAFGYTITATGSTPIAFVASGLPPGLSLSGAVITGVPTTAGTFTVAMQAANSVGSDSTSLTITISPSASGGGGGGGGGGAGGGGGGSLISPGGGNVAPKFVSNTIIETDGDGFPDEIENALRTNPTDPHSTPFGGKSAGTPTSLPVVRSAIKLHFNPSQAHNNADSIVLSGFLPVPAGFGTAGQLVVLDVGGVIRQFTLDARGNSTPKGNDTFKLQVKTTQGSVLAQDARFSAKLTHGAFSSLLSDEGLLGNVDETDAELTVPVIILLLNEQQFFEVSQPVLYSAKAGRTGRAR